MIQKGLSYKVAIRLLSLLTIFSYSKLKYISSASSSASWGAREELWSADE